MRSHHTSGCVRRRGSRAGSASDGHGHLRTDEHGRTPPTRDLLGPPRTPSPGHRQHHAAAHGPRPARAGGAGSRLPGHHGPGVDRSSPGGMSAGPPRCARGVHEGGRGRLGRDPLGRGRSGRLGTPHSRRGRAATGRDGGGLRVEAASPWASGRGQTEGGSTPAFPLAPPGRRSETASASWGSRRRASRRSSSTDRAPCLRCCPSRCPPTACPACFAPSTAASW